MVHFRNAQGKALHTVETGAIKGKSCSLSARECDTATKAIGHWPPLTPAGKWALNNL